MSGLSRRLSAPAAAVLVLLAAFVVVTASAILVREVLEDILAGEGIATVDQPVSVGLTSHRDLWLTRSLEVATKAGGGIALTVLMTAVCVAVAWFRKSWLPVLLGVFGGGGIALVIVAAKTVVGRERPPMRFAVIIEHGYSFPSGHATGTAAVALLCAWLLTHSMVTSWTGRVVVWTVAIGFLAVIGFSRVYLGVHYVSDVLAGWLLGAAWAGAVVFVGSWWWSGNRKEATPPVG